MVMAAFRVGDRMRGLLLEGIQGRVDAGAPTLALPSDSFAPRGGPGPPLRTAGRRIPKLFTGRMGRSPRSVGLHMNHRRTDGGREGWGTR